MPPKVLNPERIAAARALYDDPKVSIAVVRQFLKLGDATFARCRGEWGWPPRVRARRAPLAREAATGDAGNDDLHPAPDAPQDLNALALRLEALIASEVLRAGTQMQKKRPSAAALDRHTRIIASLTRSLMQIRQLTRSALDAADDSDAPDALGDLHAELARRLAGLRDEGAAPHAD